MQLNSAFPASSVQTIYTIINDTTLNNKFKLNMVKNFGISSATELHIYNILFHKEYDDALKIKLLNEYIDANYIVE
jgi:hypothetical protein